MRKTITLFAFMASTFCLLAQQVWREGTSWEVHYDDASVETFALQGTTIIQNVAYLNLVRSDKSLLDQPAKLLTYRNDSLLLVLEGICIEDTIVSDVRTYSFQLFKKRTINTH